MGQESGCGYKSSRPQDQRLSDGFLWIYSEMSMLPGRSPIQRSKSAQRPSHQQRPQCTSQSSMLQGSCFGSRSLKGEPRITCLVCLLTERVLFSLWVTLVNNLYWVVSHFRFREGVLTLGECLLPSFLAVGRGFGPTTQHHLLHLLLMVQVVRIWWSMQLVLFF